MPAVPTGLWMCNRKAGGLRNQGLAKEFMMGIEACVKLRLDMFVNTDRTISTISMASRI
jgi:hypothetical protein